MEIIFYWPVSRLYANPLQATAATDRTDPSPPALVPPSRQCGFCTAHRTCGRVSKRPKPQVSGSAKAPCKQILKQVHRYQTRHNEGQETYRLRAPSMYPRFIRKTHSCSRSSGESNVRPSVIVRFAALMVRSQLPPLARPRVTAAARCRYRLVVCVGTWPPRGRQDCGARAGGDVARRPLTPAAAPHRQPVRPLAQPAARTLGHCAPLCRHRLAG